MQRSTKKESWGWEWSGEDGEETWIRKEKKKEKNPTVCGCVVDGLIVLVESTDYTDNYELAVEIPSQRGKILILSKL